MAKNAKSDESNKKRQNKRTQKKAETQVTCHLIRGKIIVCFLMPALILFILNKCKIKASVTAQTDFNKHRLTD